MKTFIVTRTTVETFEVEAENEADASAQVARGVILGVETKRTMTATENDSEDFLETYVAKRTEKNPDFPALVEAAESRRGMKVDLSNAEAILEWADGMVIMDEDGDDSWRPPDRETAAYIAECVRLRQAFETAWMSEDFANRLRYPPGGPNIVSFAYDLRDAINEEE